MKRKDKKMASLFCCILLAMVLSVGGCGKDGAASGSVTQEETQADTQENGQVIGEGAVVFDFCVVDKDGGKTQYEVHTDKETVGDALSELGLIEGEESEYGLYVKTVNGITADYDKDGVYWAFYINDEYAELGVSQTAITKGEVYTFKVE